MQSTNSLHERLLDTNEESASLQEVVALEAISEVEQEVVPDVVTTRELKIRNSKYPSIVDSRINIYRV